MDGGEEIIADPRLALAAVTAHLGLPPFAHDLDDVAYDADEFDRQHGAPGLHRVSARVARVERATILPPALFARFSGDAFWREGPNPYDITVV